MIIMNEEQRQKVEDTLKNLYKNVEEVEKDLSSISKDILGNKDSYSKEDLIITLDLATPITAIFIIKEILEGLL